MDSCRHWAGVKQFASAAKASRRVDERETIAIVMRPSHHGDAKQRRRMNGNGGEGRIKMFDQTGQGMSSDPLMILHLLSEAI